MSHASQPLISIIMPAYNAERLIVETLQSIQAQTYSNWELVVVDDNSPDNTYGVLQEFAAKDSRIKPTQITRDKTYKVQSEVRNAALSRVQSEFVAFMDCDDLFEPDALETLLGYLQTHPECQCAYGLLREIDMDSRLITDSSQQYWHAASDEQNNATSSQLHTWDNLVLQRIPMMLQTCLARRSFIEEVGPLNEYVLWDDYFFFLSMVRKNPAAIHRVQHHVFRYRYNKFGISKCPKTFIKIVKNVRVVINGIFDDLKIREVAPQFTPSSLSAKMYADICWTRYRFGLKKQTLKAGWHGFIDPRVTLADWLRHCAPLCAKAAMPEALWTFLKSAKRGFQPQMQTV